MEKALYIIALVFLVAQSVSAATFRLTPEQMEDVSKIAKDIQFVQKGLSEAKYIAHALSIYRASKQYALDPHLLIAIAKQETSFKEDLPEGKAGEFGICQIRKMWVKNEAFLKEFPTAVQKDLQNSDKNFMFAAWILSDLRSNVKNHTIPYWSFYNAKKFVNRFKYYVSVNRFLSSLKTKTNVVAVANTEREVASKDELEGGVWVPDTIAAIRNKYAPVQPKPSRVIGAAVPRVQSVAQNTVSAEQASGGWIPSALRRLNDEGRPAYYQGKKTVLPAIMRAANELNIPNLFGSLPVQD